MVIVAAAGCLGSNTPAARDALPRSVESDALPPLLRVGMDAAYAPMESMNRTSGAFEGFDVDLMREVAARRSVTAEFHNIAWDDLPGALNSGRIDVIASSMTITDHRMKDRDFTAPYYLLDQSVLVRVGSAIREPGHLEGRIIGVQTQTTAETWVLDNLVAHGKGANDSLRRYPTYEAVTAALLAEEVEAVISDRPPQVLFARTHPNTTVAFDIHTAEALGLAVKKGRSDLLHALNETLDELRADGTLDRLKRSHGL